MSDVVTWAEGSATYRVTGLSARGTDVRSRAAGLREQLDDRYRAAKVALEDFRGPVAAGFHDQVVRSFHAVTEVVELLDGAAAACFDAPDAPRPPAPTMAPALDDVVDRSRSGARPSALRQFAAAVGEWDDAVRVAAASVHLDGVRATVTELPPLPLLGLTPPTPVWPPLPSPIDPATLVHLPPVADVAARAVATSRAAGELADLAARAFEVADGGPLPAPLHRQLTTMIVGLQRSAGVPARRYREELQRYWRDRAATRAGFDYTAWRPDLGSDANRRIIESVYTYYGRLFLEHPELQWAGMANMIGPSFAAGFFDLDAFRGAAKDINDSSPYLPLPRGVTPGSLAALANATDAELAFFETTFLTMQQEIFLDQAVMHEAYLSGGLPAIRELESAGLIADADVEAWGQIQRGAATGDDALVAAGNKQLLWREQHEVIAEFYDDMYERPGTGPALTYVMTAIGAPSIPGAGTFADVYPITVERETPGPEQLATPGSVLGRRIPSVSVDNPLQGTVTLTTPLPDGNIAHRDDRWALITEDTLPAYERLLADDRERADAIVASPVADRIAEYRLHRRLDDISDEFLDWSLEVEQ